MDKNLIYDFKIIFSCGTEYDFQMNGNQKIFEIPVNVAKDLKIFIPDNTPIIYCKYDILKYKNEEIKDVQFLMLDEINEIYIQIPLSSDLGIYMDNDELAYNFKDDDEIPLVIKVEKINKKIKNKIVNQNNTTFSLQNSLPLLNNSGIINNNNIINTNDEKVNINNQLNDLNLKIDSEEYEELVEDIYFHPDKITKLSAKTNNINESMLSKDKIILPIQIDLEIGDLPTNPKASLDLICVIDKSGSMSGEPMENVIKSLDAILNLIGDKDRICLITFDSSAKRITNLLQMNDSNKQKFKSIINSSLLQPSRDTNIGSGLQQALETLVQRKIVNNVSSIFLLSDGNDNYFNESNCEQLLDKIDRLIKSDKFKDFNYSLNTFGYSEFHDSDLLSKLALLKKGNFYFINDFSSTPVIFKDCVEYMQRVIFKHIIIELKPTSNIKIVKIYGDENWKINSKGNYFIKIDQLSYKRKLNFLIDVELVNLNKNSLEILKKKGLNLIKIEAQLVGLNEYGNPTSNLYSDCITFYEKDKIKLEINPEIILNFERFNLCEIIKTKLLNDLDRFDFVEKNLPIMIDFIKNLDCIMEEKTMINSIDCLNGLKLLKLEGEKIVKILENFSDQQILLKPILKESYLNLLNQRNNFNQEIKKYRNSRGNLKKKI